MPDDQPVGYRVGLIHVEMRPNVHEDGPGYQMRGTEPDPPYPGDDADEVDRLAWKAGYAATDVGYPISLLVASEPLPSGGVYGFAFHYVKEGGADWVETTREGMSYDQAEWFLEGASSAARFLKNRIGHW